MFGLLFAEMYRTLKSSSLLLAKQNQMEQQSLAECGTQPLVHVFFVKHLTDKSIYIETDIIDQIHV